MMIQNPKRTITVDFSVNQVEAAILKTTKFMTKASLRDCDDVLKIYEIKFSEPLTMGSIMIISLNRLSENKTEITMEMTRVLGSYNRSYEVNFANVNIKSFTSALSGLLKDPNLEPNIELLDAEKRSMYLLAVSLIVIIALFS